MTRAMLVFDTGPSAGLGHRARMAALAAALRERGLEVACRPIMRADTVTADVVVVDSYARRADDGGFVGRVVCAVDDLSRPLAVDLVVDPNPPPRATRDATHAVVLCGPRFALFQPGKQREAKDVRRPVRRVLVTTGAADQAGHGADIAEQVHKELPTIDTRLVLGPWGRRRVPNGVTPVEAPDGLAGEIAAADIIITAAGVSMLQAIQAGAPTVVVVTADNQRRAAVGAAEAAAVVLASDVAAATAAVAHLASHAGSRAALAAVARTYVDGEGPSRVTTEILRMIEHRP